jgi:nucleotide-binding universal stress UspA family protein
VRQLYPTIKDEKEAAMKTLETSTAISFKNILFLTDFSDASRTALVYALALARQNQSTLYPAHVYALVPTGPLEVAAAGSFSAEVEQATYRQLEDLVKRTSTKFQPLVAEGMVESAVAHWTAEHGIDLIVMGTHGRRGMERFFLGSTAEVIFRTATCPVLTVGPHVPLRPRDEAQIDKILFATDLTRESESAISYALSLAHDRGAHVTLLHVMPNSARHQAEWAKLFESSKQELKRLVPSDAELWCEPEFVVDEGDPAEQILSYAEQEKPDVIVLGLPKNKTFNSHFRSGVTYKVVSSAPCPVLTVRDMTEK